MPRLFKRSSRWVNGGLKYPSQICTASMVYTQALGECVHQENTRESWDIPWYTTRVRCIIILYHATEKTVEYSDQHYQWIIPVLHHGKVGCNDVKYTTAFLCCDWLYFLWHGITSNFIYQVALFSLSFVTVSRSMLVFICCYIMYRHYSDITCSLTVFLAFESPSVADAYFPFVNKRCHF